MPDIFLPKFALPARWIHGGTVLTRPGSGIGSHVIGDPCIVRDPAVGGYRMFLFLYPPGHGQSICRSLSDVGPGQWSAPVPLEFTNPEVIPDGTHKPYIVQDAHRPNEAAKIDGRYCLVSVGMGQSKYIHQAWASSLAGPWTWEKQPLILGGGPGRFDEKHADAVSAFYFPHRGEILYCYMGYPRQPQPRAVSPFGNAQGAAIAREGQPGVVKLGPVLPPCQKNGHWASGWVGGMQILPGLKSRWVGLINASPTAPDPANTAVSAEEPPPSLGGFAVCDEEFPVDGWRWCDAPLERMEDIPATARATGEGGNLWRHHILILPDGGVAMFYNAGHYGQEQLYVKFAAGAD